MFCFLTLGCSPSYCRWCVAIKSLAGIKNTIFFLISWTSNFYFKTLQQKNIHETWITGCFLLKIESKMKNKHFEDEIGGVGAKTHKSCVYESLCFFQIMYE